WAATQNNLGLAYNDRIRGERADNLERAITAYERALEVRTRDAFPEQWAMTQNNLATAYGSRIRGERADNLEQAIAASGWALEVYTRDAFPEQWATTQNNLAIVYSNRIRGERADNLERAITAYERALEVRTRDAFPEQWAMTQNNLATAYGSRIRGERADNLELAIAAYERALEVRTRDAFPENWAATQNNLATAYRDRIRGERSDNLERAITAYERALEVRTRDAFPEDWAATQNNLGNAYRDRIRGERADNLELAIAAYERALEVYTRDAFPQDWATTQNNLGNAYRDRIRGERSDNLELAISSYERALEVYTRDAFPQDWATTQNNLGNAYRDRIRGERADNLELAIAAYERALEVLTRDAFPQDWATTQNNLGNAYSNRIRGERADNLELAISAYERALEVRTREAFPQDWAMTQNNLATAYRDRIRGERADNLELAIAAYERALEVYTREAFPKECRLTSRSLGNLQSELQNWDAAISAYGQALGAAEDLYQACTLLDSQAGELKATADLPRRAAYAYAKAGQLAKALETIERGRARGLSERLQRDRADLAQLQQQRPDLFDRYRDITNQLQNLESLQREQQVRDRQAITPEQHRNEAQRLRQDLTEAIAQIRQVPGYETFLQAPSLTEIQQNLSTEAPTVYLIPTPNGSLALIATPQAIDPLWLDAFPEATLTDLVQTWLNASQNQRNDFPGWLEAIDQGTRQLWDNLMAPLIDRLKQHNHTQAILIPTGLLGLLPLHAAWTPDPNRPTGRRYALDELTFTYTPNAQSLVAARAIAQRFPDSHLDSILAIDNPRQDLPSSEREVLAAVKTFPRPTVLRHEKATTATVAANLGQQAIVHFSCHGTANFNEPLNSGLLMNDDLLTLRELFNLKLTEGDKHGIRLAVLSACETGLPGLDLADEAIGLPVGLLQAGVAGAIASLWAVSDLSTAILLTKFYDLWRNHHLTPPDALHQAQQWFRDTKRSAISQETGLTPAGNKDHPYHWAGFSYTGL
ncbi:CHAT domain-containing tetratricopeptide repeat protein, partial [Limnothrix redekei]